VPFVPFFANVVYVAGSDYFFVGPASLIDLVGIEFANFVGIEFAYFVGVGSVYFAEIGFVYFGALV
jgi:hypothetical protein